MHSRNLKLLKASGMDERTGFTPIHIVKAARSGAMMRWGEYPFSGKEFREDFAFKHDLSDFDSLRT